jgi:hypothetical protein
VEIEAEILAHDDEGAEHARLTSGPSLELLHLQRGRAALAKIHKIA